MRPMADERDVRLRLMHAQGNRQGRCRTSERQTESPTRPRPRADRCSPTLRPGATGARGARDA